MDSFSPLGMNLPILLGKISLGMYLACYFPGQLASQRELYRSSEQRQRCVGRSKGLTVGLIK